MARTANAKIVRGRAQTQKLMGRASKVGGAVQTAIGAAGAVAGFVSSPFIVGAGATVAADGLRTMKKGSKEMAQGRAKVAKSAAVDGLVAKARGGSAALGNRGAVPMAKVVSAAPATKGPAVAQPTNSGADRTKPYTDSAGRNYKNGRAINKD